MEEAIKIHTWHARPFRPRYYFVSFNRGIARMSRTAKLCFPALHKFRHRFYIRGNVPVLTTTPPFNKCRRRGSDGSDGRSGHYEFWITDRNGCLIFRKFRSTSRKGIWIYLSNTFEYLFRHFQIFQIDMMISRGCN